MAQESKAAASAEREFDDVYRGVVAAGEQSGALGQVLERLADDLEERQALKAKLVGAALYPAIVTLVAIAIVLFLVSYVVPQVAAVFAGTKRTLPFLTVAMLAISGFVRSYGWLVLIALVLIAIFHYQNRPLALALLAVAALVFEANFVDFGTRAATSARGPGLLPGRAGG